MNKIRTFTDLIVWQEGHKLVVKIEETYSLVDQIKRAAVPVTSNIAEGFGRQTMKEKIQFYYLAQRSLTELKNQLLIAKDVNFLKEEEFNTLADQANCVHQLLQGLIQKSKSYLNPKS